jgi:hypothetical protein
VNPKTTKTVLIVASAIVATGIVVTAVAWRVKRKERINLEGKI